MDCLLSSDWLGDIGGVAYFNTIDEKLQYNRENYFPI